MNKSNRKLTPAGPEMRAYPARFEVRAAAGSLVTLTGYASIYDEPYEMFDMFGPYNEVARSGMCAKTITDGCDTAYLANHEGLTIARSKAGTLKLSEDSTGLLTEATVNTARSDVRDLVTAIEDGNVDQMSFGFRIIRQQWSPDYDQRDLTEVSLDRGDVSAVNFGANSLTSVGAAARSFRSLRPAELQRMADELAGGDDLTERTRGIAARVLGLIARADDRPNQALPADLVNDPVEIEAEATRRLDWRGYLDVLRLKHDHENHSL